jgi:hypothetical protein
MYIDKMSLYDMSVDKMTVGKITINEMNGQNVCR